MSNFTPAATGDGLRANIQRFGAKLSGMVMPNIGAFIAFGLITALFIPDGWTPNEDLAELVGPMIIVLIPPLIGYTGGKMVHGQRGAVIGAVATIGAIVGADVPMFLGAMIMGPLGRLVIKQFDEAIAGKVKPGFEMLIDNFSIGILGARPGHLRLQGRRADRRAAHRPPRRRRRDARRQQPAPARLGHHRAGQGAVPQQRDQPRRAHAARRRRGRRSTASRSSSCSRPTPAPASASCWPTWFFGPAVAAPDGTRGHHHPLLRRHPRDLLPVRADEAQDDPRDDRRWRLRHRDLPALQRRPRRPARTGQHHRLHGCQTPKGFGTTPG